MEISTKNIINCQFLDCKQPNLCVGSGFSGCSHKNWHLLRPSLENGGKQNLRACARTVAENSDSPLFMASANSAISRPSTHRETGATLTKLNFLPRYRTRSRNDCRFLAENFSCMLAVEIFHIFCHSIPCIFSEDESPPAPRQIKESGHAQKFL